MNITKSEAIRNVLVSHPDEPAAEIKRRVKYQYKLDVSTGHVHSVRHDVRRATPAAPAAAPPPKAGGIVTIPGGRGELDEKLDALVEEFGMRAIHAYLAARAKP